MPEPRLDCPSCPSIGALVDHFAQLATDPEVSQGELQSLLDTLPEWATFHEVRSALGVAGLGVVIVRRHAPNDPAPTAH